MKTIKESDITQEIKDMVAAMLAANEGNRSPKSVPSYRPGGVQFIRECIAETAIRSGGLVYVTHDGKRTVFGSDGSHDGKVF